MKIPQLPPAEVKFWKRLSDDPERFAVILREVTGPTHMGRYIHWDKLRFLKPPGTLTLQEWWFALKIRRGLNREIPLKNKAGETFKYCVVDPLPEQLHLIDLSAGGTVQIPEPVLNPDTKDSYLVRSLIEEAITSSQLEGAATTREVAKAMIREGRVPRDRSERMILNNYRTMQRIS